MCLCICTHAHAQFQNTMHVQARTPTITRPLHGLDTRATRTRYASPLLSVAVCPQSPAQKRCHGTIRGGAIKK